MYFKYSQLIGILKKIEQGEKSNHNNDDSNDKLCAVLWNLNKVGLSQFQFKVISQTTCVVFIISTVNMQLHYIISEGE